MFYNVLVPSLENAGPVNMALEIAQKLKNSGMEVQVYFLSNGRRYSPLAEQFNARKLTLVNVWSIRGVLHTHGLRPDLIGSLLKLIRPSLRVMTTIHMHFLPDTRLLYSRFISKSAFRLWIWSISRFDRIVCISNAMRRYYARHRPDLRYDMIYNFRSKVSERRRQNSISLWISKQRTKGRFVALFAGAYISRKNVIQLAKWGSSSESVSILFCGQGPLENELQSVIRDRDNLLNCGFTDNLSDVFPSVDFLILPSSSEGLPLVVLEAASAGKPSLMSNIGVHRELARLGLGIVFDHHTFSDLDDLVGLFRSQDFSSKTRELVEKAYSVELSPDKLGDDYVSLISKMTSGSSSTVPPL